MFELTFQFENGEAAVSAAILPEETLLDAARRLEVAIDAPCSGNGSCGKCRVKLLSGEVSGPQTAHISAEDYADGWRLACCSKALSDVKILVPASASAFRSNIKTADLSGGREFQAFSALQDGLRGAGISMKNRFRSVLLTLRAPTLDDTMPDTERLERATSEALGGKQIRLSVFALRRLPEALRASNFRIRVIGEEFDSEFFVYDVRPDSDKTPLCALGIDVGTTTVSAVLFDLESGALLSKASCGNAQIRYGADVINRIIEQGRPGGIKKLQNAILKDTLCPLTEALCKQAGLEQTCILRLCIASNTTMNHLLVGIPADPIRTEPYIPAFFHLNDLHARDLSLPVHPDAAVRIAPNIGSYVGGDITAGTFAGLLWDKDELSLFIDLGTNGEIVFGNRDFLVSCACSAGPAFEGGDISCGMRATDGAIEAVTIDEATLEPSLEILGNQKPIGLCGSGIIDAIAELFRCGAINARGTFIRESSRIAHDRHGAGRYILAFPEESADGREIALNEVDIMNFIRAKGAVYSAIDTLLSAMDMDESVLEGIYVAGGIGSGINMKNAVSIGMFPNVPQELFHYIGNSSLSGAYAIALSDEAEEKSAQIARSMTYMELSTHPGYMDAFVAACFLPHTDAERFAQSY